LIVERVGRTLGPEDDWVPVLLVEGSRGRTIVGLSTLFSSEPAKAFAAQQLMPALLRLEEASGFALVFTAWMTTNEKAEPLLLPPSQDPDRVEAVVVTIADTTEHEVWVAPIERHSDETPTLGPWERIPAVSGPLVDPLLRAIAPEP